MAKVRTEGRASKLLAEYEHLNDDLDSKTLRQMAIFALVHQVGIDALEALFDRPLGQTPRTHRSWFWYMAMRTSGLEPYWEEFASKKNSGVPMRDCLLWLKEQATDTQWEDLSRRIGTPIFRENQKTLDPYRWTREPDGKPYKIWTRGGTWDRRSNITKICLLREWIERDHSYNSWTERLGPAGARQIERELFGLINPAEDLAPRLMKKAVEYVRRRIPEILDYKHPTCSYKMAAWFFQQPVQDPTGKFWNHHQTANYPMKRTTSYGRREYWDWLPESGD